MSKRFWYSGLFLMTFLIGSLAAWLMLRESPKMDCEFPEINSAKIEDSSPVLQSEMPPQPKVFRVEGIEVPANEANKHFIEPGEVSNGEDFKIKSGEKWIGLFGNNKKFNVRQREVQRRKVVYERGEIWTDISVKEKEKPLFLVKNLKNFKAGKVTTLFSNPLLNNADENHKSTSIEKGFYEEFKLSERKYTLRVEEGVDEENKPILALQLESGNESQTIHYSYDEKFVGTLFWVGDLDSDGKLDIFMDFWGYEKGYYSSGLFLSSKAEKGQIVKRFEYYALGAC